MTTCSTMSQLNVDIDDGNGDDDDDGGTGDKNEEDDDDDNNNNQHSDSINNSNDNNNAQHLPLGHISISFEVTHVKLTWNTRCLFPNTEAYIILSSLIAL